MHKVTLSNVSEALASIPAEYWSAMRDYEASRERACQEMTARLLTPHRAPLATPGSSLLRLVSTASVLASIAGTTRTLPHA